MVNIIEHSTIITTEGIFTPEQYEAHLKNKKAADELNAAIIAENGGAWDKYTGVTVLLKTGLEIHATALEAMNMVNGTTTIYKGVERFSGCNSEFVQWLNNELMKRISGDDNI